MKSTKKTPKVRFPGFSNDWEQRKLKDEFSDFIVPMRDKPKEFGGQIPWTRIEDIEGKYLNGTLSGQYVSDKTIEKMNLKIIPKDSLIVSSSATFGVVAIVTQNLITNQTFIGLVPNDKDNLDFWYIFFQSYNVRKYMKLESAGSTIFYIARESFEKMPIRIPNKVEMLKIGQFFSKLDTLITLQQHKLDNLKEYKKGMLQNMFPKKGEKVPKVRFPEFTDDWEQRKLGDIYGSIGNAFVGTATPYYVEQGHFYLESNNVKDGQINHNAEIFINDEFYEKQKDKWLHTGDMVMVQSGHVGHAAVIPEELDNTAAHALIMFRNPKEKIEPYFLNYEYQTDRIKKKIENITTGNTIKHILASDMQGFEVNVPKYEEQEVIAEYFRSLDNLITLQRRKIDELKEFKKGMLQQMFV